MKSFLGNFYGHLAIFIWSHWLALQYFHAWSQPQAQHNFVFNGTTRPLYCFISDFSNHIRMWKIFIKYPVVAGIRTYILLIICQRTVKRYEPNRNEYPVPANRFLFFRFRSIVSISWRHEGQDKDDAGGGGNGDADDFVQHWRWWWPAQTKGLDYLVTIG